MFKHRVCKGSKADVIAYLVTRQLCARSRPLRPHEFRRKLVDEHAGGNVGYWPDYIACYTGVRTVEGHAHPIKHVQVRNVSVTMMANGTGATATIMVKR